MRTMLAALRHRGPDGEQVVSGAGAVLGAVRLAVMDPERGAQPMTTGDGRHVAALNGEIVNHVELREELAARGARLRTRCDTEVLLELLARDGESGLGRLDGMFAVAFLDTSTGDLLLARDPCGIKPLYWMRDGDRVLFASEPKALRAVARAPLGLDEEALLDHLAFQLPLTARTFFSGVRRLAPGQVLRLRRGREPETAPLPRWHAPERVPDRAEDAAAVLRGLLRTSVERHLRSDVPLGAHLSGGTDSSLVAAHAARALPGPLLVFTGAFDAPGCDEREHARAVAAELSAVGHEVLVSPDDLAAALVDSARAMDEPAGGPGLLPQWWVNRRAAQLVKVVLGGQGGDELFGGYVRHLLLAMAEEVRGGALSRSAALRRHEVALAGYGPLLARFGDAGWGEPPAEAYFRLSYRGDGLEPVLSGDLRRRFVAHPARERFVEAFRAADAVHEGPRTAAGGAARFDRRFVLPALLHVEDRTSMTWSLESRVPLLGRPVLSFVERLPDAWLFTDGEPKGLLRRAVTRDLPQAAARRRDKMGFPVPLGAWARGPLRAALHDLLLDGTARSRGLFDPAGVERVLAGEGVEARHLWALIQVELWLRDNTG